MEDVVDQAAQLARANRLGEAERLLAPVLSQFPTHARALHLSASIAEVRGDLEAAAQHLRLAASAHPGDFVLHAHLAAVLRQLGGWDESIAAGERARALRPDDAALLHDLAIAYREWGDAERAAALLQRALKLAPALADAHNSLGLIALQAGRFEEAVTHFERFLAHRPDAALGYVNLLDAYTMRDANDVHLKEIERRLALTSMPDRERILLRFAASKAYADLGRRDEALHAATAACAIKRASIQYDEAAVLSSFAAMRSAMPAELVGAVSGQGFRDPRPVFVVSMPRAGSTLVEQMLASHPQAHGAGELSDFSAALTDVLGADDAALPRLLARPDALTFERIGARYMERVAHRAPGAARIVDKQPGNFLLAGVIHLALPDAKIIHVTRSPVDTCVSCFTRHFATGLHHTYDMGELGRYYRGYHELMAHWRAVLPQSVLLDVRYEDVVSDPETQARRLLAHCGLDWDANVLAFHESRRQVKTHSVAQVRRPLYKSAVGRWRDQGDLLRPLLDALGDLAEKAT